MKDPNLADVLWNRYRAWADVTFIGSTNEANRKEIRDKAYRWIIQHIAMWMDRIELEPNFDKRIRLINRLIHGPLPEAGSVDFDSAGTDFVDPEEASTSHKIKPDLAVKRSVLDAPPKTDQKAPLSPFGYGTGWSEFCL